MTGLAAAGPGVPGEAGEPGEAADHPDGGQSCEPPLLPALLEPPLLPALLVCLQVWSNPDYCSHLVSSLPSLSTLDQQDVTMEMKGSAKR